MRRDFAMELGYCCDAGGEDEVGGWGALRVYMEKEVAFWGCFVVAVKSLSGTMDCLSGRRSLREVLPACTGFLWGCCCCCG